MSLRSDVGLLANIYKNVALFRLLVITCQIVQVSKNVLDFEWKLCRIDGVIQTKNCLHMGKFKNHLLHQIYELKRLYTGLKSKF